VPLTLAAFPLGQLVLTAQTKPSQGTITVAVAGIRVTLASSSDAASALSTDSLLAHPPSADTTAKTATSR
jgi:hypothetical protein